MFDQVLNTPLINYLSVLTLKSLLSFELLPFEQASENEIRRNRGTFSRYNTGFVNI